jgi:hypothetical protein
MAQEQNKHLQRNLTHYAINNTTCIIVCPRAPGGRYGIHVRKGFYTPLWYIPWYAGYAETHEPGLRKSTVEKGDGPALNGPARPRRAVRRGK